MLQNPNKTIYTICYLLLSCGHIGHCYESSMTHRLTPIGAVTCDHNFHKITSLPKVTWEEGCVAKRSPGRGHVTPASLLRIGFRRTVVTIFLISHKPQRWSWKWMYRQKPTYRAFQRYFCRTETLSSFRIRIEKETFHRRRLNGVSHCENGEQNPTPLTRATRPNNR